MGEFGVLFLLLLLLEGKELEEEGVGRELLLCSRRLDGLDR